MAIGSYDDDCGWVILANDDSELGNNIYETQNEPNVLEKNKAFIRCQWHCTHLKYFKLNSNITRHAIYLYNFIMNLQKSHTSIPK